MERPLYVPIILGTARDASDTPEGGVVIEAHTCPACGRTATRAAEC